MKPGFSFPTFRQPACVVFSGGSRKTIGRELDPSHTVLFISGSQQVRGLLEDSLGTDNPLLNGDRVCVKPDGEPTREMVRFGAEFVRRHDPKTIIGIGGGSVLDWCRLSWAESADLIDDPAPASVRLSSADRSPDFWLIPTTPASGAEAAAVAVMLESDGRKIPVVGDQLLASHVVLDGQLIVGLSGKVLANSIGDLLSHSIESAVSIIQSPFAFDAAVAALQRVIHLEDLELKNCHADRLLEAAMMAGIAASNASVGAAHAFAHSVARFGVGHGFANAIALPAVIEMNAGCEAMKCLVQRLSLESPNALSGQVRKLTVNAGCNASAVLVQQLQGSGREKILDAMERDVCLRTNPKRVARDGLAELLDKITGELDR